MNYLYIDIETAPIPGMELSGFDGESYRWRDFDPASVKVGNLKDEEKIRAKIDAAQDAHSADEKVRKDKLDAIAEEYAERATLDPFRSYIQAIGWRYADKECIIEGEDEGLNLRVFWEIVRRFNAPPIVGWNSHNFDFPRISLRSQINGIRPSPPIFSGSGWIDTDTYIDLKRRIAGNNPLFKFSLDDMAAALGIDGKTDTGEIVTPSGRVRKRLPHELRRDDPDAFREYLARDVEILAEIGGRIL